MVVELVSPLLLLEPELEPLSFSAVVVEAVAVGGLVPAADLFGRDCGHAGISTQRGNFRARPGGELVAGENAHRGTNIQPGGKQTKNGQMICGLRERGVGSGGYSDLSVSLRR